MFLHFRLCKTLTLLDFLTHELNINWKQGEKGDVEKVLSSDLLLLTWSSGVLDWEIRLTLDLVVFISDGCLTNTSCKAKPAVWQTFKMKIVIWSNGLICLLPAFAEAGVECPCPLAAPPCWPLSACWSWAPVLGTPWLCRSDPAAWPAELLPAM